MPDQDPPRPDGFDLVKGGTAIVYVDGERRALRRPKHGEYKQLVLKARERDDELAAIRNEAAAATAWDDAHALGEQVVRELTAIVEQVELEGTALEPGAKAALLSAAQNKRSEPDPAQAAELIASAREWGRRLVDREQELHAEWMRIVFNGDESLKVGALADKPLPGDPDEWPTWILRSEYPGMLIAHWAADPLGPTQR